MSWGKLLQPDLVLGGSILNLTPQILQQHQLRGLVLDVDETLVPLRVAEVSAELQAWVKEIRSVTALWLVSNNLSENRIARIAYSLNLPYIAGAAKPSRRKLRQAVENMKLPVEQVAMVGDRLFTDILAGNRLGMFTILVEPMSAAAATPSLYPWRAFEVWVSQALGASLTPKS
ncbi:MAG: YqeG family HAD IIIA-type phosphatase [Oscillatoriaceae bacterium SKW80]|nr:YqeG family HAD IIIA-type phosphatase [Oscillatoriaceae bacterium SKYG93]MCX8122437.1 YqeG family HAD IIIA-type phosphatase [Oscillatoriaceae bacterium SKW80]MDW8452638.1 YqeG family HAD IIIA-type phosphatase [Oscillatoriaceae cyanobacterium SKYGB_i_bin93]HIK28036.1 YqeG family HAD IIIA-type phosphatase [Oscillatoriaceae cyanobacterium M7585_C2015_266]